MCRNSIGIPMCITGTFFYNNDYRNDFDIYKLRNVSVNKTIIFMFQ